MAYDPVVRKIVLVGGRTQMPGQPDYPEDAWSWDGAVWTQLSGAPRFHFPFAAYDPSHQLVAAFGFGLGGIPETWTWDGVTWLQKKPSRSPSVTSQSAMCFDHATTQILLYGGVSQSASGGVSSETWLWDGTEWNQATPIHNPGARFDHALACGPQSVLFGGFTNQSGSPGIGTWIWDGADWQQVGTARVPSDCCGAAVFDGSRLLIFVTGQDGIPIWQWSDADWTRVA